MKVSVIGTGYVGLVSGVCLAEKGHEVVCVDIDKAKVDMINGGRPPIYEVGLEELLKNNIGTRLKAVTDLADAVHQSEITLIAVGTPFDGERIDLTYVKQVSREIGKALAGKDAYHVVVVKSTVVPGTTDEVVLPILEETSGKKAGPGFGVGMNPEFLTEGIAVTDFMQPDRIVIGGCDERALEVQAKLYAPFEGIEILRTNCKTAEMIKYSSNAMLATCISFMNELANLCSALGGIDIVDVTRGLHLAHYLNPFLPDGGRIKAPIAAFFEAGCGFGGSCLPKDVKALVAHGENAGQPMPLLDTVIKINRDQYKRVIDILTKHLGSLKGKSIGVLGLAFKPDTDDMRETPAVPIINTLHELGAQVKAFDPVANDEAHRHFDKGVVDLCDSIEEAVSGVDAVVLVTRWDQFKVLPELLAKKNPDALLVDARRMLDKTKFARYDGIGM